MQTVIRIQNLSKTYISRDHGQKVKALEDINLEISSGEIFGVLGGNGAGKTTLFNILSGLVTPDKGIIEVFEQRLTSDNVRSYQGLINVVSGYPNFQNVFNPRELLFFYGRLYGLKGRNLYNRVEQNLDAFGIGQAAGLRMDELSSGLKQRVALAKCFINNPKIIFLDEPTRSLDVDAADGFRDALLQKSQKMNVTIVLATHNLQEVQFLCNRIVFLKEGKLLNQSSLKEFNSLVSRDRIQMVVEKTKGLEEGVLWLNSCAAFFYRGFLYAKKVGPMFMVFMAVILNMLSFFFLYRFIQFQPRFFTYVLIGVLTWGFLYPVHENIFISFIDEIWSKSIKHIFLAPIGIMQYLVGVWIISILRGFLMFVSQIGLACLFLGFHPPSLMVICFFLIGLSLLMLAWSSWIAFLVLLIGKRVEPLIYNLLSFMVIWSGIYYSIDVFPRFLLCFAKCIPLTYFLEYIRQNLGFAPKLSHVLIKGFVLTAVYFCIGLGLLKFAVRRARQNGDIIRMSE